MLKEQRDCHVHRKISFFHDSGNQKITTEILTLAAAYHHGRLPDCEDENGKIPILKRLEKVDEKELQ